MGGGSTDWSRSSRYDWKDEPDVVKKSARDYAKTDRRTYSGNLSSGLPAPVGMDIHSKNPLSVVLVVDVTGSMKEWPGLIFEKIPTLYNECNAALQKVDLDSLKAGATLDDKLEMAVIAVGDVMCDNYPLQVVDFSSGPALTEGINRIKPEGGGGGNLKESYDLAAYYLLKHCKIQDTGKIAKPILVIAGDEGYYLTLSPRDVKKYTGDDISKSLDSKSLFTDLTKKYDTYLLRPELSYSSEDYAIIHKQWQDTLGPERVLKMDDPKRLVDCIIGICAYAADNFSEGEKILRRRQTDDQVDEVLKVLHPLLGSKKA